MNPKGSYGTHLHPLLVAVLATNGDVVEFGMGDYSTPLLHEVCNYQKRMLYSMETDKQWFDKWQDFHTINHRMDFMYDWDDLNVDDVAFPCSVIFIDHAPAEQRQKDIVKYQDSCEIMVAHDTEKMRYYGYDFSMFKYQYQYQRYDKKTTLLSKTIDVSKLFV